MHWIMSDCQSEHSNMDSNRDNKNKNDFVVKSVQRG